MFFINLKELQLNTCHLILIFREMSGSQKMYEPDYDYYGTGALCFKLPGRPFVVASGQESATIGKVFVARIFEEMYKLGYDFITCSDLTQTLDQGNLFFKKSRSHPERRNNLVLCVAPGGMDKIILARCPDDVKSAIKDAISKSWREGIQSEESERTLGIMITKLKLNGNPWNSCADESVDCRKLLISIIENLEKLHWRFHAIANIKGGTDSLFFMYDPDRPRSGNLSMLSLNRTDRLRLINFSDGRGLIESVAQNLKETNGQIPDRKNYYGSTEFKVSGTPFYSSGYESIASREMIAGVLQVLRQNGYEVLTGIDVSRKLHDKSSILFRKCNRSFEQHSCISLNDVDKIRIINFPSDTSRALELCIQQHYLPGIQEIKEKGSRTSCCQLKLNGSPWSSYNKIYSIHGKSMLMMLLREASRLKWELVASVDVSAKYVHQDNGPDYPIDVHAWFFKYTRDGKHFLFLLIRDLYKTSFILFVAILLAIKYKKTFENHFQYNPIKNRLRQQTNGCHQSLVNLKYP